MYQVHGENYLPVMFIVLLSHAIDCYLGNKVGNQLLEQANREVGNVIILIQCIVRVSLSS